MTDIATPVAAWYPDPAGHADWRWWDGTRWTAEVRSAEVRSAVEAARGSHVAVASPPPPTIAPTPTEDRAALYAARRDANFAEMSQTSVSSVSSQTESAHAPAQFGARPFGAPEQPDRYRAAYEEKTYQAWRKNNAATGALVFAGINLALMVYAFIQNYEPYYRIVPSVIGIVASIVAMRQARETGTGHVKSVIALVVNVVVGAVAAFALLQFALGLSAVIGDDVNGFLDTPNAVYSDLVESSIQAYAAEDQGQSVIAVDCPDSMRPEVGEEYTCTETLGDGSWSRSRSVSPQPRAPSSTPSETSLPRGAGVGHGRARAVEVVPDVGLEPTRPCGQSILSAPRLPIPPIRRALHPFRGEAAPGTIP